MCLTASVGNALRQEYVLAVTEHPRKGITRKRRRRGFPPRHNHSRVKTSGEGHRNRLTAIKITSNIPREDSADLLVIGFWIQRWLVLPLMRLEVATLFIQRALPEMPL